MEIKEKFVETKFGKICYLEYGTGEKTAVFFHGFLGGARHGESFATKLAGLEWRVLVPYLPGHKKSFEVTDNYYFKDLVLTMLEFVTKTTKTKCVLAGHSLGGAIAWEIACLKPEVVEKLILIDPGLGVSRKKLIVRGTKAILNNLIFDWRADRQIYPQVLKLKLFNLVSKIKTSTLSDNLPVLLLVGKDDKVTPLDEYRDKLKNLKNLKIKVFVGGHHWYSWQRERYLKEVEDFI